MQMREKLHHLENTDSSDEIRLWCESHAMKDDQTADVFTLEHVPSSAFLRWQFPAILSQNWTLPSCRRKETRTSFDELCNADEFFAPLQS